MDHLRHCRHYDNILPSDHGYLVFFNDTQTWNLIFGSAFEGFQHWDFSNIKHNFCHELFQYLQWFIYHYITYLGGLETELTHAAKNRSYDGFPNGFVVSLNSEKLRIKLTDGWRAVAASSVSLYYRYRNNKSGDTTWNMMFVGYTT